MLPITNSATVVKQTTPAVTDTPASGTSTQHGITTARVGSQICRTSSSPAQLPSHAPEQADQYDGPMSMGSLSGGRSVADAINCGAVTHIAGDINSLDEDGNSALHRAVLAQNYQAIETLLGMPGINLNIISKDDKNTPLNLAAKTGHRETVAQLLQHAGVDLNCDGALVNAARQGHVDIMQQLIAAGANVNAVNKFGVRPLELATFYGKIKAVQLLTSSPKIDLNATNKEGYNALSIAAKNGSTEIVQHLLSLPDLDRHPSCPLVLAAANGHQEVIRLLLNAGIDPNQTDAEGNTALMEAVCISAVSLVETLLGTPGLDCNAVNHDGESALHTAAEIGYRPIIDLLLAKEDIEIDAVNDEGHTALHIASIFGHLEIVELLKERMPVDQ